MPHENCHDLLSHLSDYLDGDASAEICADIERHLATCADCRVVVDTLHQTVLLFHELPQPEFPADARARLYKALDLADYLPS